MPINFEEALKIILENAQRLPNDNITIAKAVGRVIRDDITAEINVPPFTNSAMDGYCVRLADLENASAKNPVRLKVIEDIAAGSSSDTVLGFGQTVRIMTGAPVPIGTDAVVRQEDVDEIDDEVLISHTVKLNENIRKVGEDIPVGTTVLQSGKTITPADLGVLASLGRMYIRVSEQPRVVILATGDELISIDEPLSKGKIRSSNTHSIMGLIELYGGKAWNLGKVADDKNRIKEKLYNTQHADIVITMGGVSVGKYDVVKAALAELGVEELFWKVNIKPGKPLFFGKWDQRLVFGLPGNPVSSIVCFEQFVVPLMNKMMGKSNHTQPVIKARLRNEITKKPGLRQFFRGNFQYIDGGFEVTAFDRQGSGVLTTMSFANCFILGKEDTEVLKKGEMVEVQIRDFSMWT